VHRRLAAILFADIVGYSRLVGHDEPGTFRRVKALRAEVLEPVVAEHGGHIVSYAGDGALAEFPSIIRAVECALAIQRTMTGREPDVPPDWHIVLRIGIHLGDILADSTNNLCGDAVNIAARLEQLAPPGGICLSDRAYAEMADRVDAAFAYGGEPPLKNIGHQVGIWLWPAGNRNDRAGHQHAVADQAVRDQPNRLLQGAGWPAMFENVPPRDFNFTGREDVLASLHRLLMQARQPAAVTQIAIHGLGGMGKTTLAAEYAYRHAGEYAGFGGLRPRPGPCSSPVSWHWRAGLSPGWLRKPTRRRPPGRVWLISPGQRYRTCWCTTM
jgi:class 3 adenylate cyclase